MQDRDTVNGQQLKGNAKHTVDPSISQVQQIPPGIWALLSLFSSFVTDSTVCWAEFVPLTECVLVVCV